MRFSFPIATPTKHYSLWMNEARRTFTYNTFFILVICTCILIGAVGELVTSSDEPIPSDVPSDRSSSKNSPILLTNLTRLIYDNQFRSDCATRRFLYIDPHVLNWRRPSTSYPEGSTNVPMEDSLELSKLHLRLAGALAQAVHMNRTLVFSRTSRVIRGPKSSETELTPEQVVKILMRKCSIFHPAVDQSWPDDKNAPNSMHYHHSCWFQPLTNCRIEDSSVSDPPDRILYSDLIPAQASLWVPPIRIRHEEDESHRQLSIGLVERWSSALVSFIGRPVPLLEKHLLNYVHRVSDFITLEPDSNHPHLAGVSIRSPPISPTSRLERKSFIQEWKQYLQILEQLIKKQSERPIEERLLDTRHIWISSWEEKQNELIESWHDRAKMNNTWLKDQHFILSHLRPPEPDTYGLDPSMIDSQLLLEDRFNLQALHSLEDVYVLGRTTFFIGSLAQSHSLWIQLIRNGHQYPTPPIWVHISLSAESIFPSYDQTGFAQDYHFLETHPEPTIGDSPKHEQWFNFEKWLNIFHYLGGTDKRMKKFQRLSSDSALPDIPFNLIDQHITALNTRSPPTTQDPRTNSRSERIIHDEL